MQSSKTIDIIEPLTGPMNRISWEFALKGVLARHSLIHCIDTHYIRGGNIALDDDGAEEARNNDPNQIHHAFTENNGVFTLVNAVANQNQAFPGNLRENMAAISLIIINISANLKMVPPSDSTCAYAVLQKLFARTNTVNDQQVKTIVKDFTNFKMEATESISEYMDRFRKLIRPIMANTNVRAFATLDTFAKHKVTITDGLTAFFANQKGRINDDATVNNLDELQTLLEKIEVELDYKPIMAVTHLDISEETTQPTPKHGKQPKPGKPDFRYNPLAKAKKQVPREYICKTCNGKGSHWSWQCKKDPRFNDFIAKKGNTGKDQRYKGKYDSKARSNLSADDIVKQVIETLKGSSANHNLSNELREAIAQTETRLDTS
ncbi:hypothetical protein BCR33DRAFT_743807 [Rhizoclosmatium globosum]|uniref:CCHC-type domain-containing protein n=1 Tax=Rhizoclosmatium globosum TaxID=329046 RepID=A0A1Y2BGK7_9FUNG|nr:hypothetical protein BCR33DRAFT_743807 [Rhizoclosmatium globosum]|eukprot:ORY33617.1 hypothetical protein BCR33DRAFT_743807 [Rhizoclosmatium globosum]